jgi:hypothetical protein
MGDQSMLRLWICLPICLLLSHGRFDPPASADDPPSPGASYAQDPLPIADPVEFLQKCLDRYDQQKIQGYTDNFIKQERLAGKLQEREEIEVTFREQPHSVFMHWVKGQKRADNVLYVEGENNGMMLAHPAGLAGSFVKVVARDPEGEEAKASGRYSLKVFGLRNTAERSLKSWKTAKEKGTSRISYLGVRKVFEIGDKPCYTLRRVCDQPEEDGVSEITIYIDKETWLRAGTVLKSEDGKLMGEYLFRDVHLNPEFKPNQFTREAVAP